MRYGLVYVRSYMIFYAYTSLYPLPDFLPSYDDTHKLVDCLFVILDVYIDNLAGVQGGSYEL